MGEGLDPSCRLPAYVCGRLLAEYENLQWTSNAGDTGKSGQGKAQINSSVTDRYFSMASTYPALAFPKIACLGQRHLRKLWRDRPSAASAIESRLRELHALLSPGPNGAYPAKLKLDEQGLFVLGYYHHKAAAAAAVIERKHGDNEMTDQEN